ncbi:hypothetical protein ZWY2020_042393 [Hordeum vulgare]|nr:hypothetical protein ZWY2020_042393 [Hordeum vulgare]
MVYKSTTTFEDVKLTPEVLKGLHDEMGLRCPSKIQAITLPINSRAKPNCKDPRRRGRRGSHSRYLRPDPPSGEIRPFLVAMAVVPPPWCVYEIEIKLKWRGMCPSWQCLARE